MIYREKKIFYLHRMYYLKTFLFEMIIFEQYFLFQCIKKAQTFYDTQKLLKQT